MSKGKFDRVETTASVGNFLKVAIAAVSWANNRLDIFRTGDRASDLQHNWWDGTKVSIRVSFWLARAK